MDFNLIYSKVLTQRTGVILNEGFRHETKQEELADLLLYKKNMKWQKLNSNDSALYNCTSREKECCMPWRSRLSSWSHAPLGQGKSMEEVNLLHLARGWQESFESLLDLAKNCQLSFLLLPSTRLRLHNLYLLPWEVLKKEIGKEKKKESSSRKRREDTD